MNNQNCINDSSEEDSRALSQQPSECSGLSLNFRVGSDIAIAVELLRKCSATSLKLDQESLNDSSAQLFSEFLMVDESMETLDVNFSNLTASSVKLIMDSLYTNVKISMLNIGYDDIDLFQLHSNILENIYLYRNVLVGRPLEVAMNLEVGLEKHLTKPKLGDQIVAYVNNQPILTFAQPSNVLFETAAITLETSIRIEELASCPPIGCFVKLSGVSVYALALGAKIDRSMIKFLSHKHSPLFPDVVEIGSKSTFSISSTSPFYIKCEDCSSLKSISPTDLFVQIAAVNFESPQIASQLKMLAGSRAPVFTIEPTFEPSSQPSNNIDNSHLDTSLKATALLAIIALVVWVLCRARGGQTKNKKTEVIVTAKTTISNNEIMDSATPSVTTAAISATSNNVSTLAETDSDNIPAAAVSAQDISGDHDDEHGHDQRSPVLSLHTVHSLASEGDHSTEEADQGVRGMEALVPPNDDLKDDDCDNALMTASVAATESEQAEILMVIVPRDPDVSVAVEESAQVEIDTSNAPASMPANDEVGLLQSFPNPTDVPVSEAEFTRSHIDTEESAAEFVTELPCDISVQKSAQTMFTPVNMTALSANTATIAVPPPQGLDLDVSVLPSAWYPHWYVQFPGFTIGIAGVTRVSHSNQLFYQFSREQYLTCSAVLLPINATSDLPVDGNVAVTVALVASAIQQPEARQELVNSTQANREDSLNVVISSSTQSQDDEKSTLESDNCNMIGDLVQAHISQIQMAVTGGSVDNTNLQSCSVDSVSEDLALASVTTSLDSLHASANVWITKLQPLFASHHYESASQVADHCTSSTSPLHSYHDISNLPCADTQKSAILELLRPHVHDAYPGIADKIMKKLAVTMEVSELMTMAQSAETFDVVLGSTAHLIQATSRPEFLMATRSNTTTPAPVDSSSTSVLPQPLVVSLNHGSSTPLSTVSNTLTSAIDVIESASTASLLAAAPTATQEKSVGVAVRSKPQPSPNNKPKPKPKPVYKISIEDVKKLTDSASLVLAMEILLMPSIATMYPESATEIWQSLSTMSGEDLITIAETADVFEELVKQSAESILSSQPATCHLMSCNQGVYPPVLAFTTAKIAALSPDAQGVVLACVIHRLTHEIFPTIGVEVAKAILESSNPTELLQLLDSRQAMDVLIESNGQIIDSNVKPIKKRIPVAKPGIRHNSSAAIKSTHDEHGDGESCVQSSVHGGNEENHAIPIQLISSSSPQTPVRTPKPSKVHAVVANADVVAKESSSCILRESLRKKVAIRFPGKVVPIMEQFLAMSSDDLTAIDQTEEVFNALVDEAARLIPSDLSHVEQIVAGKEDKNRRSFFSFLGMSSPQVLNTTSKPSISSISSPPFDDAPVSTSMTEPTTATTVLVTPEFTTKQLQMLVDARYPTISEAIMNSLALIDLSDIALCPDMLIDEAAKLIDPGMLPFPVANNGGTKTTRARSAAPPGSSSQRRVKGPLASDSSQSSSASSRSKSTSRPRPTSQASTAPAQELGPAAAAAHILAPATPAHSQQPSISEVKQSVQCKLSTRGIAHESAVLAQFMSMADDDLRAVDHSELLFAAMIEAILHKTEMSSTIAATPVSAIDSAHQESAGNVVQVVTPMMRLEDEIKSKAPENWQDISATFKRMSSDDIVAILQSKDIFDVLIEEAIKTVKSSTAAETIHTPNAPEPIVIQDACVSAAETIVSTFSTASAPDIEHMTPVKPNVATKPKAHSSSSSAQKAGKSISITAVKESIRARVLQRYPAFYEEIIAVVMAKKDSDLVAISRSEDIFNTIADQAHQLLTLKVSPATEIVPDIVPESLSSRVLKLVAIRYPDTCDEISTKLLLMDKGDIEEMLLTPEVFDLVVDEAQKLIMSNLQQSMTPRDAIPLAQVQDVVSEELIVSSSHESLWANAQEQVTKRFPAPVSSLIIAQLQTMNDLSALLQSPQLLDFVVDQAAKLLMKDTDTSPPAPTIEPLVITLPSLQSRLESIVHAKYPAHCNEIVEKLMLMDAGDVETMLQTPGLVDLVVDEAAKLLPGAEVSVQQDSPVHVKQEAAISPPSASETTKPRVRIARPKKIVVDKAPVLAMLDVITCITEKVSGKYPDIVSSVMDKLQLMSERDLRAMHDSENLLQMIVDQAATALVSQTLQSPVMVGEQVVAGLPSDALTKGHEDSVRNLVVSRHSDLAEDIMIQLRSMTGFDLQSLLINPEFGAVIIDQAAKIVEASKASVLSSSSQDLSNALSTDSMDHSAAVGIASTSTNALEEPKSPVLRSPSPSRSRARPTRPAFNRAGVLDTFRAKLSAQSMECEVEEVMNTLAVINDADIIAMDKSDRLFGIVTAKAIQDIREAKQSCQISVKVVDATHSHVDDSLTAPVTITSLTLEDRISNRISEKYSAAACRVLLEKLMVMDKADLEMMISKPDVFDLVASEAAKSIDVSLLSSQQPLKHESFLAPVSSTFATSAASASSSAGVMSADGKDLNNERKTVRRSTSRQKPRVANTVDTSSVLSNDIASHRDHQQHIALVDESPILSTIDMFNGSPVLLKLSDKVRVRYPNIHEAIMKSVVIMSSDDLITMNNDREVFKMIVDVAAKTIDPAVKPVVMLRPRVSHGSPSKSTVPASKAALSQENSVGALASIAAPDSSTRSAPPPVSASSSRSTSSGKSPARQRRPPAVPVPSVTSVTSDHSIANEASSASHVSNTQSIVSTIALTVEPPLAVTTVTPAAPTPVLSVTSLPLTEQQVHDKLRQAVLARQPEWAEAIISSLLHMDCEDLVVLVSDCDTLAVVIDESLKALQDNNSINNNISSNEAATPVIPHALKMPVELNMSYLEGLAEAQQKLYLGTLLLTQVSIHNPEKAIAIRDLLLEMDVPDIVELLQSEDALVCIMDEALKVLDNPEQLHTAKQKQCIIM